MLNFDRSAVKLGTQNIQNDCHQWLYDSFRVHQIRFCPGSHWGSLQRSPRPSSWFSKEEREGKFPDPALVTEVSVHSTEKCRTSLCVQRSRCSQTSWLYRWKRRFCRSAKAPAIRRTSTTTTRNRCAFQPTRNASRSSPTSDVQLADTVTCRVTRKRCGTLSGCLRR